MMNTLRTFLTMALLVLTCVAGVGIVDASPADQGFVTSARGAAGNMLNGLPESGALLLWAVGLAVAARVFARKGHDAQQ